MTSPFADLAAVTALPRITGLAASPDGSRLVASVQQPDAKRARYVSALWDVPLDGGAPVRLTRSERGESEPAFLPDGTLLFTSRRPEPGADDDDSDDDRAALWALPPHGEARVLARRPGGLGRPVVAAMSGNALLTGSRLTNSTDGDDTERRAQRKDRAVTAILHTGMPIRHWDHELGDEAPRLLLRTPTGVLVDLAPDATTELVEAGCTISADGARVATQWRTRAAHGGSRIDIAILDVASGARRMLCTDGSRYGTPVLSPDGARVAVVREREATFDLPFGGELVIVPVDGGEPAAVDLGDLYPAETAWSPDSVTLYVTGERNGRGPVLAVDAASATVSATVADDDAAYATLLPTADGAVYALRSGIADPPAPVRLSIGSAPLALPTPAPIPPLPGRVEEVSAEVDGVTVRAWLCVPDGADGPVPLMQWIHGGPFLSYNSWSWRWIPWVAVAHGWAVLMPDPALSTGYGQDWHDRAWPYLARVVWRDIEGLLDSVLARPDIDAERVALLGGSFGGFMTNWIAGHTDRFGAIVTHAGLWALDQQHATTDNAEFKTRVFGRMADHPEWYAENSPHLSAADIRTPMLVVHGNRDYRVPVSEALRLWWDLVNLWDGDPAELPHRFLQLTGENHWVLSPANAEIWWDAVLGFCAEHVLGRPWTPSPLL